MLNKEKLIDNICPPNKRFPKRFFFFKRKPEGKKGVGEARGETVSYTHLTLPTIRLV